MRRAAAQYGISDGKTVWAASDDRGRWFPGKTKTLAYPGYTPRPQNWFRGPSSRARVGREVLSRIFEKLLRPPGEARVRDLEKLQAAPRRVCTIDNQQFGSILFRRGSRTLPQDLDRHFERLPLLVQRRHLRFDPCDRSD
jgi:hypothetical protein